MRLGRSQMKSEIDGPRLSTDQILALTRVNDVPTTLVDSNVLLDVITEHDEWMDWSATALSTANVLGRHPLS